MHLNKTFFHKHKMLQVTRSNMRILDIATEDRS